METLYFTLGIASVVVAAVAVGAVWAMLKVAKLNSMLRDVEQQFESTHRDITMVEQTVMNQIQNNLQDLDFRFDRLDRSLDEKFSAIHREIEERSSEFQTQFDEVHRTIDSRVDKLAAKQERQLLKG